MEGGGVLLTSCTTRQLPTAGAKSLQFKIMPISESGSRFYRRNLVLSCFNVANLFAVSVLILSPEYRTGIAACQLFLLPPALPDGIAPAQPRRFGPSHPVERRTRN